MAAQGISLDAFCLSNFKLHTGIVQMYKKHLNTGEKNNTLNVVVMFCMPHIWFLQTTPSLRGNVLAIFCHCSVCTFESNAVNGYFVDYIRLTCYSAQSLI